MPKYTDLVHFITIDFVNLPENFIPQTDPKSSEETPDVTGGR